MGKGSDILYTLLLRLSAPLQSWGSESMYDNRETDYMPTKSGIIGLLAAALGVKRGETKQLEELNRLGFGVRIDLQGVKLNDFQVTHMGEKLNANLSNKVYLSDAIFLAGLSCEDITYLEELKNALIYPRYSLFLGRRSCPPTQPLVLGIRDKGLYEALYNEEWLVPVWMRKSLFRYSDSLSLRIVIDSKQEGEIKRDVPISFSPFKREYGYRYRKEMISKKVNKGQELTKTEHDPMQELRW